MCQADDIENELRVNPETIGPCLALMRVSFFKELSMKTLKLALIAAAAAVVVLPAQAQSLTFNIGVVSLYKSNGVDADSRQADVENEDEVMVRNPSHKTFRPAVQGGVDYDFGNGFYVGNWNSTGKFGKADIEIDLYAGYANELGNGLSYDLGVARFIYPGAREAGWNLNEAYFSIGYGIVTFDITRGLSDANKKHSRFAISVAQPLNDQTTLTLVYGDRNKRMGNFSDFAVSVDHDLGDDMTLTATVSGAGKKAGVKPTEHKSRLIVGLSKSF